MAAANYSFGTGDLAAERLLVLAGVFAPTMAAILGALPARRWPLVVDLGCGPGSTTTGLQASVAADRLVGVDASSAFVELARRRLPEAEFVVGDVLADAWPLPPADLLYARFLLSHLPDPVAALRHWQRRLAPGGMVVVEEPERIESAVTVFDEYQRLTQALVASRGATMLVGEVLGGIADETVVVNRALPFDVASADAATMFLLNLQSWRDDPWIVEHRSVAELDAMAGELERYRSGAEAGTIHWTVRQLVLGRMTG